MPVSAQTQEQACAAPSNRVPSSAPVRSSRGMPPLGILEQGLLRDAGGGRLKPGHPEPVGFLVEGVGDLGQEDQGREPVAVAVPHLVEAVVAEAHQLEGDAPPQPGPGRFVPLVHVEVEEGGVEGEVPLPEDLGEALHPLTYVGG